MLLAQQMEGMQKEQATFVTAAGLRIKLSLCTPNSIWGSSGTAPLILNRGTRMG